ncbi:FadR/GntR family transcriptional regulator [Lactonifactor longoviformis]|uniref:GntR family transcriptional regulator, transcriptional repressor for pyruvate dehydrogenase complex n=1 Tax=Lactonifactor longoviformis DSM 17459 TaxID=1122155 RepID=A0A1M4VMK2_9CLOT|nr:FadR/GntR family transcriptional regulator [Lactonifactor longoviformis]SHE70301.1 GntR family transcriptional regulator, transcriptional repressor for pyruvate dehydrogenase complex [Lactonifactor longoviformis DSM 17459]
MSSKKKQKFKYDIVADEILASIAAGKWKPGDKMPSESELIVMYKVSRVTLRESLKKLSMMGVLSIVQGDGTYVNEIRPSEFMKPLFPLMAYKQSNIEEIYDARTYIESGACELAAQRRTQEDVEYLQRLLEHMNDSVTMNRQDMYSKYDHKFHRALCEIAGNEMLLTIFDLFEQVISGYIEQINISPGIVMNSMIDHQILFQAVEEKRHEYARLIMFEHLRKSKVRLIEILNKRETL